MAEPELILASTSRYRRELLQRLGIPFRCLAPEFHEDLYKDRQADPLMLAGTLAAGKAWNVAQQNPEAIVIGADQLAALEGEILGKPGSSESAIEQLTCLSGRTHELITAVCLVADGRDVLFHDVTRLTMRPLFREEIVRYIARDEPYDCAGSYKIEQAGIALFERIDTEDFTAIVGLPLLKLSAALREMGLAL